MTAVADLDGEVQGWLSAVLRKNPGASKRLRLAHPSAPAQPELRDIQQALARERGFDSWQALTAAVAAQSDARAPAKTPHEQRVADFLQLACWDHHIHGRDDHSWPEMAAGRLLRKHPEIARDSIYTAVVSSDVAAVERILAERPSLVNQKGGVRGWEPILYLCYGRLPIPAARDNAAAVARALLDRGANPNAYYMAGDALYGTLVGVAGEGEQEAPPHPAREALYQLLLDRGAELYDIQVLYNTHFRGDLLWWLELTYAHALKTGRKSDWDNPDWPMLDMGGYGSGARFLLETAIDKNDAALAEWALARGANPDPPPAPHRTFSKRSVYEDAVALGCTEIAALLVRHGAPARAPSLEGEEAFVSACLRLDRDLAAALAREHPEYLRSTTAIFAAAGRDRPDAIALLLELGVPVDLANNRNARALHEAACRNALAAAAFLLERGADANAREAKYDGTPLQGAAHFGHEPMIDLLTPHSRDIWYLTYLGKIDRLRQVLSEEPALAKSIRGGVTPLWWLPDDERLAVETVELFVAHGTDPAFVSENGTTGADFAERRGLDEAAASLRRAQKG